MPASRADDVTSEAASALDGERAGGSAEHAPPRLFEHPYAEFLHRVDKPTRYTGAEHGSRRKDWTAVDARVCLAFPDIYDIGMSHLGYRILYRLLNDDPRTLAERCYMPWVDLEAELRERGMRLRSLESGRALADFDVVGFSLQFELTYTNVLAMLDLGGLPLRAEERGEDAPLVIAGGPVATHAEPMAPFFDALLIGDGEEALTEIALLWASGRRRGASRRERLAELATLSGVYVPSLYETEQDAATGLVVVSAPREPAPSAPFPVKRRVLEDLSRFPFPDDGPVGGPEAIFERMSIEVARGCTEGCRFCQAGMIYRPVREREPREVVETVTRALEKSGQDEVALAALSTADLSTISPLITSLVKKTAPERVSLGVASLRAYGLSESVLDDMRQVRASGLTFAPEAGTQRLRDVINKNVTEAQLLETAERTFSRGFDKMKLYFILGLPTETDEDVLGICAVARAALAVGRRVGRGRAQVTVSASTFVPKPHTPFQWCAQDSLGEVRRKQALLRQAMMSVRGVRLRLHDSATSVLEGVLARGDRPLGLVIERAYRQGARLDSWDDQLRLDLWEEAFAHFEVDTQKYLTTLPLDARLPWDHIDVGLAPGFLAREYRQSLRGRLSPPCGKAVGMFTHHSNAADATADERKLVCYDCGIACDLTKMRTERVERLVGLGAVEPRAPGGSRAVARREGQGRSPGGPESHRPERAGGTPERWRLGYEKLGPMALLGHLDLGRELPRVLRRAGLRVGYSQGFHPQPLVSYGPALSLGVASLAEVIDVRLIDAPDANTLVERLNGAASRGLRFLRAVPLSPLDGTLSTLITGATYVLGLDEASVRAQGGEPWLRARLASFLAETSVVVTRQGKHGEKPIDVRRLVSAASLGGPEAACALEAAGFAGQMTPVVVTAAITPTGSARIGELASCLFGDDVPFLALRVALHAGTSEPFELAAHRRAPAQTA